MFHPTHRTARLLRVPMANTNFSSPSVPYSMRHSNLQKWTHHETSVPNFHPVHRSASQLSAKAISTVKSTKSISALPVRPNETEPKSSIIEAIRAFNWDSLYTDWGNRSKLANVLQLIRNIPSNMAAMCSVVANSREYELARNAIVAGWQYTVWVAQTAYFWLGLFLESREYFYLRYYTLLTIEHTISWLRYGLQLSFDLIRKYALKKQQ